jgi:hypothetical protein
MLRDACAVIAIKAPDGDRRAHDVCGPIACSALLRRGDGALLHVGHEAVRILPATGSPHLVDGLGLPCLAEHRQQMPLPRAAQERLGHRREMLPAFSRPLIASPGGEQLEMGRVLPMAPMGVYHGTGATPARLPPAGALAIIQALHSTAHERAQYDRGVLVQGRAKHRRHRQDDVPRDDALRENLAPLTDPVVDLHVGAPQAYGRLTTHRHQGLALATVRAARLDIPHVFRVAPPRIFVTRPS